MKKLLIFGSAIAIVFSLAACTTEHAASPAHPEVVRDVAVLQAAEQSVPDTLQALGTVKASETAQIAAQMMGTVTAVNVREGDVVKRGQVLIVLDASQPQAGVDRAQAALAAARHEVAAAKTQRDLAESTLTRYATLYQRKSVSPQEYDEIKARAEAAAAQLEAATSAEAQSKAAVAQAHNALAFATIRAPFDGIVTERKVDSGAMATPGTPLMTIEANGRFRVEVNVDESSLRFVKLGSEVPVTLDAYPDLRIKGRVAQIVPAVDPASRSFVAKLELPRLPEIRSGLSARAAFVRGTRAALTVPKSAIVERGAMKAVYIVGADQVASLRYVTVGNANGADAEILTGLAANEVFVRDPAGRELGGKQVEVAK